MQTQAATAQWFLGAADLWVLPVPDTRAKVTLPFSLQNPLN